jgi:tRNA A-37 threonylcarbamoyl transferase component Bud32
MTGDHESARDQQLEAILVAYLEAVESGQAPKREEFLAAHPEFAAELAAFLDGRERIDRLAVPLQQPVVGAPTLPHTDSSSPTAPLGTVRYFGDYELLEEIARGGMGIVYKARQVSLNRRVALKVILANQFASRAEVERFHVEAEAAAQLDHPNIVPIYEIGEHEGQQYFSMKLIEGAALAQRGEEFQKDPKSAARLVATVAQAVHHAHQRGILHRDLKPANILLDAQNQPYVSDFGLAKLAKRDGSLTQSGAVVGTPSYMPPEQALGKKDVTTAADVYSLGATLYDLLAGRPPFHGPTALDILVQVTDKEPTPPSVLNQRIDRDLETICLKCLRKEPEGRYASAEALAEDLARWVRGDPIQARPMGQVERTWKWMKRHLVRLVLTAVFAYGSCVVVLFFAVEVLSWQRGWSIIYSSLIGLLIGLLILFAFLSPDEQKKLLYKELFFCRQQIKQMQSQLRQLTQGLGQSPLPQQPQEDVARQDLVMAGPTRIQMLRAMMRGLFGGIFIGLLCNVCLDYLNKAGNWRGVIITLVAVLLEVILEIKGVRKSSKR